MTERKEDIFRDAARWFLAGFAVCAVAALAAFASPERFAKGTGLSEPGVRVVRDRYEIAIYYDRSDWIASGALPYTEASYQEYPPLGAFYIAFPRFFGDDILVFEAISLARSVLCFALLFAVTAVLLRRFRKSRKRLLFFFLPAFLYFSLWRYDAFPALFASLAVLAVTSELYGAAVVALAAGAAAKIYPAFFLLPLGMRLERGGDARSRASMAKGLIIVATFGAGFLLAAKALGMSPLGIFASHVRRAAEIGSVRELVLRWAAAAGLVGEVPNGLVKLVFGLLQFGAALPLLMRARVDGPKGYVRASLYILLPFIAFGWFFSQQWIIWLAPLALLVADRTELYLLAILDLLLYLQFPLLYDAGRGPSFDAVTVARTFVLCWLWAHNARKLELERA